MDFFDLPIGSDLKNELDENLKPEPITNEQLEEMEKIFNEEERD